MTYPLASKLQRVFENTSLPCDQWRGRELAALDWYQERMRRARFGAYPDDTDVLGWWGIMQQYGAATRLTDWTESPLIALWFAYAGESRADRALFRLDPDLCLSVYGMSLPFGREEGMSEEVYVRRLHEEARERLNEGIALGIRWPLSFPCVVRSQRIDAQRAWFVIDGTLTTSLDLLMTEPGWRELKEDVKRLSYSGKWMIAGYSNLPLWPGFPRAALMQKIILPCGWREEVLDFLASHGICTEALFPDVITDRLSPDTIGAGLEEYVRTLADARDMNLTSVNGCD